MTLLDIYNNKPGVLAKQYEESKSEQKKRGSVSSYKKERQEKEIKRENQEMFNHLVKAEPSIGTQKEWNKHYEQHREMEKKLMSQNKEITKLK